MCEFLEYDGADYRPLPPNGGVDDLLMHGKDEGRRPRASPARQVEGPDPRAADRQTAKPARHGSLGWTGGKAGT